MTQESTDTNSAEQLTSTSTIVDRQRGALIGLAVGDALGAAVEFMSPGNFEPVTNYRAGGPHRLNPGEWTDDTSMALALADSIGKAGWDLNDQAERYVAWWKKGEYSVNGSCFDIGMTCRSALSQFQKTGDAATSGSPSPQASGNGSIMRLAPVPIRFSELFPSDIEQYVKFCVDSSRPTHGSDQCLSACAYFGLVLAGLIHGLKREEVLDPDWQPLTKLKRLRPMHPEIAEIAEGSFRRRQPPQIAGSGYVVKSLEAALWAFHDAEDFRSAVLRAVNLGDDADTTGAVCGQLAGAHWGESGIEAQWQKGLARQDLIEAALVSVLEWPTLPGAVGESGRPHNGVRGGMKDNGIVKASMNVGASYSEKPLAAIDPERFPPRPTFLTSNRAHKGMNETAVSKAFEFASRGAIQSLAAMDVPPSPKLKSWHYALICEVACQLERPPEKSKGSYQLATADAKPPTTSSYWVIPGKLLAGAYPGDPTPEKHHAKIQALVSAGIRTFVNLMEEDETNYAGDPFVPYHDVVQTLCPDATCCRYPIEDLSLPSHADLKNILARIDESLAAGQPTYVHCWGGVGRTGTVIGCWLLCHDFAQPTDVLERLQELRQQDQERRHRISPETAEQQRFVKQWLQYETERKV